MLAAALYGLADSVSKRIAVDGASYSHANTGHVLFVGNVALNKLLSDHRRRCRECKMGPDVSESPDRVCAYASSLLEWIHLGNYKVNDPSPLSSALT